MRLADLGREQYRRFKDMVHRMELTYDEIVDILDIEYIAGSTNGCTPPTRIYEISNLGLMLKPFTP